MEERERILSEYFKAWVNADSSRLREFFSPDILYSECYGPEYHGLDQVIRWFVEWQGHGRVLEWRIKQFLHQGEVTAAEWYFQCEYDGEVSGFDGVTLAEYDGQNRIVSLKEFQSKAEHHCPF